MSCEYSVVVEMDSYSVEISSDAVTFEVEPCDSSVGLERLNFRDGANLVYWLLFVPEEL